MLIPIWFTNLFLMLDGQGSIVQQLFLHSHFEIKRPLHINGVALKCFPASAAVKGAVNAHGQ
ncbi:hypothetical protein CXU13_02655 [Akkermansia muciniphila]|nr:hypothetical protein CXU13_02655 [Akkermansia muciniphila]